MKSQISNTRNARQVAQEFGVTKRRVYQLVHEKKLNTSDIHERAIMICVDKLYKKTLKEYRENNGEKR